MARLTGSDAASVSDLVQEVMLAAVQGISKFDPDRGALTPWLLGIAHRKVALYWRKKSPNDQGNTSEVSKLEDTHAEATVDSLGRKELAVSVRKAIAGLPAEAAALLTGRYLEDRTTHELAVEFGTSEQAIRSRLSRARERFRETFPLLSRELV